jgi:hypothetical protein
MQTPTERAIIERESARRGTSLRLKLGFACFAVFCAFVVALAVFAQGDPVRPLRFVAFTLIGVLANYFVCLASVLIFSRWVKSRDAAKGFS